MSSQYNLQLKATLDTSQVQQELQKLRELQDTASMSGGSSARGMSAASSVAGLDLRRLSQSVQQLEKAMLQLQKTFARAPAAAAASGRQTSAPGGMPIAPGKYSQSKLSKQELYKAWLGSGDYKAVVKKFNEVAASALSKDELKVLKTMYGGKKNWVHNAIKSGDLGPGFDEASYNRQLN